ncbi:serine/threonine-protein kinase [Corallococcus sp. CA053C]|uniref:protein kinase domain-containing protein n=1 Tax=Corallococcus sp. CA053C TaxID=2316732 RepID=UPI000EA28E42|nr:serine/threonine-protein kinase [Corallococcus sp. CA053C]RKH12089.1 serine/threonine-protein kinase [Corallococcus sp. CA053C]
MNRDVETELRLAMDEGLLPREEAAALREEARRLGRSPLELLRARGVMSEQTLASLLKEVSAPQQPPPLAQPVADETPTLDPARIGQVMALRQASAPAFPISSGWDRYQYVRFLGQGGMGRVFLALDPRLRRHVALKFVLDDDEAHTRRFISEARAQAKVQHERVCQVYEVGHVEGKVFIAMQYIDGQPLSALVRSLTVEQKALVMREAALGVHEAHRVGLIHRDIKPSNIMVERADGGTPRPYVMDFGLARDWNESMTATGAVLGTPHYMAPEQARGEVSRLDRRADVYSLGASLYFLLTGQVPIPGDNGLEVLNNIPTTEPKAPRLLEPGLPADLEFIALKCLEKERSARYDSARALAEDLDRFLSGEPVLARTGFGYSLRKRLRKHRLLASVSAAGLLAVTVALGWGALARREAAERERIAQRFTELVEHIESGVRYSALSRVHDTREDRRALQRQMAELEAEIAQAGPRALGPGYYALGRGHLALGEEAKARELLESAWSHGFHAPRAAYALALVTGRRYQQQLLEAQRIFSPELREASTRDAERLYRDPALAWLKQSEGAQVPSAEYVAALVAFYEGRFDEALALLEGASSRLPWFHELPMLRGDLLEARGFKRWNGGDPEGARADFEAGRKAYATAAATAESEPAVYRSLARLEADAMVMELYGKGDVMPSYQRALDAVARCLTVVPDDAPCLVRMARVHHRLAEYRLTRGGDGAEPLAKAIEAAQRARTVEPTRSEATLHLARSTWLQARYRVEKGEDPRELLGKAAALFESIPVADRDRGYYGDSGLVFKTWADYEDQVGVDSQGSRDKAIRAYEAAIALDPRIPEDWINLGSALLTRASLPRNAQADQDLKRAADALAKAQTLNPQHMVSYFYAGEVHAELARRRRNRGEDVRPELELALEQYRRGLAINPRIPNLHNGMGAALLLRADDAWNRGGDPLPVLDEARASFEQAIAVSPGQGFAYANLGSLLARRCNYLLALGEDPRPSGREAEAPLRRGLERMPGATWLRGLLGTVHVAQARFELEQGRDPGAELSRALEELHAALEKNAQDAEMWLQLGKAQVIAARWKEQRGALKADDMEAAARSFEKAITLSPDDPEYRLEAGLFYRLWVERQQRAGRESGPKLQRGLELAEQVLKARPDWPVAQALRAGLRLELADTASPEDPRHWRSQALEELTQALKRNPNLAHEWNGLLTVARRLSVGP